MRLNECAGFLLLICCICLQRVEPSLPSFTPATAPAQVSVNLDSNMVSLRTDGFRRLPGLCRRLRRRRITVLCNSEKFCWRGQVQEHSHGHGQKALSGQVCLCPRGSKCSRFFIHSL